MSKGVSSNTPLGISFLEEGTNPLKEVIVVHSDNPDELQSALRNAQLLKAIGVIVTEPKHLNIAQEFGIDIVAMYGKPEQAIQKAQEISEDDDVAVVVITGETNAYPDR